MKNVIIIILFLSYLVGCSQEPKIEITKEYIVNKYWDKYQHIILIEKMKVKKDSTLNIFDSNFKKVANHWNIVDKLEVDSSFVFRNSVLSENIIKDSLYFNKSNIHKWSLGYSSESNTVNIIGKLENNKWYRFSYLRSAPIFYYIFIDSTGTTHQFIQDLSNY